MGIFSSPSPEDTVKARKAALESYTNLVPAQQNTQKYQRDLLQQQVMNATGEQAQKQQTGAVDSSGLVGLGTLGMLQKAASTGAKLLPQQRADTDALNLQGALSQQAIANAKTTQATKNTTTGMENETQRLARLVADRAFQAGMEAKQLVFSANNALADYALTAMKKDFEEGRLSQKEIRDLTNNFKLDALKKKQKADQSLEIAKGSFLADMQAGNADRAKSRMLAAMADQKAALEAASKAQATATIVTGILETADKVLGDTGIATGVGKIITGAASS